MRNILIEIEYDGTNYCGWQWQPKGRTIQGEIEKAVKELVGKNITIYGSGRTDAGVHAKGQTANFHVDCGIPLTKLPLAINHFLPEDISIIKALEVPQDFHARYSAIGKEYTYLIYHHRYRSALLRNYSYYIPYPLVIEKMTMAAGLLLGTHDFRGFMNSGTGVKTTVRTIHKIDIIQNDHQIVITFSGDGFLYNMVRIMVGTFVEIASGKRSMDQLKECLEIGKRSLAGHTAPPEGLYLNKVFYPLTH